MLRVISLLLALGLATIWVGTLAPSSALEASSHSAVRSFSQPWAMPGGRLVVTITATNYGGFEQVEEALPEGFSYTGSSLSEGSVTVDGQTVSFVLLGDGSFTYTVDVPGEEGDYAFSGILKDAIREEMVIGELPKSWLGQNRRRPQRRSRRQPLNPRSIQPRRLYQSRLSLQRARQCPLKRQQWS